LEAKKGENREKSSFQWLRLDSGYELQGKRWKIGGFFGFLEVPYGIKLICLLIFLLIKAIHRITAF